MTKLLAATLALLCAVAAAKPRRPPSACAAPSSRSTARRSSSTSAAARWSRSCSPTTSPSTSPADRGDGDRPRQLHRHRGLPGPDGTLRSLEVLVFPEAARGTGEGHVPWDLEPGSTMTNATVAQLAATPQGRSLTLKYKDGEKTVSCPTACRSSTFKPGDRRPARARRQVGRLRPGARRQADGVARPGRAQRLRAADVRR